MKTTKRLSIFLIKVLPMLVCIALLAVGCGGSGGGSGSVGSSSGDTTISGVAAAGAPIAGTVQVKGANGNTASSTIEIDGSFSLDVSGLTAPYILCAEGSVNGEAIKVYSAGVATGNINITPITDFIVRKAVGGSVDTAFDGWNSSSITSDELTTAKSQVKQQLQPLLSAAGVADNVDLLSSSFTADHTGVDAVLDSIDITYTGDTATVENTLTGSTFTDDVTTTSDDSNALPSSDEHASQNALTDGEAINQVMQILVGLYANGKPTATELNNTWAPYVADDFLEGGESKTEMLDSWVVDDEGPGAGFSLSTSIIKPLAQTDLSGTGYSKGYLVYMSYADSCESESFKTTVVYDGTRWLWRGDGRWMETDMSSEAHMSVSPEGVATYTTGVEIGGNDSDSRYAYNQGVRSAVVTGPGLPAEGMVLEHTYPDDCFHIYPEPTYGNNHLYRITDDSIISAIPDNAEYTTRLYAEEAATLDADPDRLQNYTPLQTYTDTIGKKPRPNSELDSSVFPALTSPTSHALADANIPGVLNISWTNPTNANIDWVDLNWWNGSSSYQVEADIYECTSTTSSVTLDSTGLPAPDNWANIWMSGEDMYGREITLDWQFN